MINSLNVVIPANAGIQNFFIITFINKYGEGILDPRRRGDDKIEKHLCKGLL